MSDKLSSQARPHSGAPERAGLNLKINPEFGPLKDLKRVNIKEGKRTEGGGSTRFYDIFDKSGQLIYKAAWTRPRHKDEITMYDVEAQKVVAKLDLASICTPVGSIGETKQFAQVLFIENDKGVVVASSEIDSPFRYLLEIVELGDNDCCCCPGMWCCFRKCCCDVCCGITTVRIKQATIDHKPVGSAIGVIKIQGNQGTDKGARAKIAFPAETTLKGKAALLMTALIFARVDSEQVYTYSPPRRHRPPGFLLLFLIGFTFGQAL